MIRIPLVTDIGLHVQAVRSRKVEYAFKGKQIGQLAEAEHV